MKRLAHLEHHVVGDIHDVVDRTKTDGLETLTKPVGAGSDLDAFDDTSGVVGAGFGGFEFQV